MASSAARMEPDKPVSRQGKGNSKTRYHLLLDDKNYDFLLRLAEAQGLSVAAALNKILHDLRHK